MRVLFLTKHHCEDYILEFCGCVYAAYAVSDACPFILQGTEAFNHRGARIDGEKNGVKLRGMDYSIGDASFPQDKKKAIKLWSRAAELGSIDAHFALGHALLNGEGV